MEQRDHLRTEGRILFSLVLTLCLAMGSAYAEMPSSNEWIKASSITAAGLALGIGFRFVPTNTCAWCATNAFDETIGRAWASSNRKAARITSDVLTFGLVPLMAATGVALFAPNFGAMVEDALVIVSSAAATSAITEIIKVSARRQRPEATFGYSQGSNQDNRSFLSGHTSFSFSVLTSASVVAIKRCSRLAPLFTTLSALAATSAGISRIAAAKHWATDVIAGTMLGIGIGASLPYFILDNNTSSPTARNFYMVPDPLNYGFQVGMAW